MINKLRKYILLLLVFFAGTMIAAENKADSMAIPKSDLNVREMILDHVADSYEWHITNWNNTRISIQLPVILYSQRTGWVLTSSSSFENGETYKGFYIATDGDHKGKIVEKDEAGNEVRPFDISITKTVLSLLINCALLVFIILFVARSYKRKPLVSKSGFVGLMEMFIMNINDDVIKSNLKIDDYRRFGPYLLTVFFFVFINNLMGTIPIFPGGGNVTGNIAVTFVLAIITFLLVNLSGTKEYWKDIFWPEVPLWMKAPVPMMPVIEIVGILTKPFALMIRLFANMLAGHSITLGLVSLIFVTVSLGQATHTSMTLVSVILTVFINLVELLVVYIQAYIFTMLSAVFISLARIKHHH